MRYKLLFIIGVYMFPGLTLWCQCPNQPFFKDRFNAIYHATTKTPPVRLKELLQLDTLMQHCRYDKDSTYILLLQKIGLLYYLGGNFPKAVAYTERSIRVAQDPLPGQASYDSAIIQSYYNLNVFYDSLRQEKKAYDVLDSCISYSMQRNTAYDIAGEALENKVDYLFNKGDYRLCRLNALVGEGLIENYYHGRDSITFINYFITSRINSLSFSNKMPLLEKLLKTKEKEFTATRNTHHLGVVYATLAQINNKKKDFPTALFYFKKAYQANTLIKYRNGICENLTGIGKLYAKGFLQFDRGLAYCDTALKYADGPADSLIVLRDIADIYAGEGKFDKADYFFRLSFNTLGKDMDEAGLAYADLQFDGFNIYQDILDLITDKGNSYQQRYQTTKNKSWLDAAIKVFKNGDLFLTRLKEEMGLQFESNLVWRIDAHSLYEHGIEACYANQDVGGGFYFFEKSRAILLNDQVKEQQTLAETDIAKAAQLDQEINKLDIDLQGMDDRSKPYVAGLKKLYIKSTEREALSHQLSQKRPSALKNGPDTSLITLQQVRKEIVKEATLLEIFTGDSAVYVLTVTPTTASLRKLNKAVYDSLSRSFISLVSHPAVFEKDFNEYVETAYQLYSFLFKKNPLPPGRIIISPDAGFFPFEALVTEEKASQPHYFLEKYITSYAYSARFLGSASSAGTREGNSLLGIAPVRFDPALNLAGLPGSDVSLEHIQSSFGRAHDGGALNMVNEEATRANFLRQFSNYNVIQLYTHASDSSVTGDPVIYFADSALYLSQLVSVRKPIAQLIVLSACETATGRLYQGEGVFSFNRSFAALGIPAAVSNLWTVDNESIYSLTELFYKYVAQGLPTDLALQKAKLEFIGTASKERQYPYYWGATLLVGKSMSITRPKTFPGWLVLVASLFLGIVIYFAGRKFRSLKQQQKSRAEM